MIFDTAKILTFALQTEPLKQNHSNLNYVVTHGSCALFVGCLCKTIETKSHFKSLTPTTQFVVTLKKLYFLNKKTRFIESIQQLCNRESILFLYGTMITKLYLLVNQEQYNN